MRQHTLSMILAVGLQTSLWLRGLPVCAQTDTRTPSPTSSLRLDVIQRVGDHVRAGTLAPDKVLRDGGLMPGELLRMLELRWFPAKDRVVLAGLLVKYGPDLVEPAKTIEPRAKLALAEYFRTIRDPRLVPLLQERLAAIKQPHPESLVPELNLLASYYIEIGQLQKALDLYLQAPRYSSAPAYLASHLMHAARTYRQLGNEQKAQELLAQVPQHGFAWATGMLHWELAAALMEKGQHDEARRLLQEPLTGLYADQIQVGLLSLLAKSYYRTADFKSARKYAVMAQAQYKSLTSPLQGEGLDRQVETAREIERWSEQWSKAPVVCEPAEVRVPWPTEKPNTPIMQHIAIRAFRPVEIDVSIKTALPQAWFKARLEDGWRRAEYFFEKQVTIEVALPMLTGQVATKEWQGTLVLKSARLPDLQVPVRIKDPPQAAP